MNNLPLVSVVVITYNSSLFVLETLESIKNQTYQNIELIISDDHSKDDTVALCKGWIERNVERFVRTSIVTTPINTGTAANCNRGYSASNGEWIKAIAGDDLLLDDCIANNMNHIQKNAAITVLFSEVEYIQKNRDNSLIKRLEESFNKSFFNLTTEEQYHFLLFKENCILAPTAFIKREVYAAFNFDERIKLIEDYPYWIKLTKNKVRLYFMEKKTVGYRLHDSNTSFSPSSMYVASNLKVYIHYIFPAFFTKKPIKAVRKVIKLSKRYVKSYLKEQLKRG